MRFAPRLPLSLLTLATFAALSAASTFAAPEAAPRTTWMPDNGNGTFTNPLFYDEFSDPDIIRVGDDFYLAGTTMHAMPSLVVLHSKDLVNWEFLSYAAEKLDLGPEFRLEEGKNIYGQGIWAPCIRHHDGTFYIFSNVNGRGLQLFTSRDPAGPWQHRSFDRAIHDLSVLFDDDGRVYAVFDYADVKLIEFKPDFSGFVEGSERVIIPASAAMGEGHHIYKINGKYTIISANYAPVGRMQCARADKIDGPYETAVISARETMGTQRGWWCGNVGQRGPVPGAGAKFDLGKPGDNVFGANPLHQGGIVDLPNGDWWGFSMMDFKSIGRTTFLSPVTWQDGWPYFGLPGNLGRSPRTWIKPAVSVQVAPAAPYQRSDDFSGSKLLPVWQWNHAPVANKWSLSEKTGALRLHTLPAEQFLVARNTLTQRVIGPESSATVTLDSSSLQLGDIAGLGLLNMPCAWIGVARTESGAVLRFHDQFTNTTLDRPLPAARAILRVVGDYDNDLAVLSFSTDGTTFTTLGAPIRLPFQLKTFQGPRYALFAYNTAGRDGGFAEFDDFRVAEPLADRSLNLPLGKVITLTNLANGSSAWANPHGMLHSTQPDSKDAQSPAARFRVHDRGQGRVALEALDGSGFVTVVGLGLSGDVRLTKTESAGSLFQWQDMLRHQCMLLSLKTHRHVGIHPQTGEPYSAESPGANPDRKDGAVFAWAEAAAE
ncbi:MAG: glycoside hydrolase 43 family protein [Opitutaceae bacterium]|nr:glycoside hydrolase 43 family protein [Opitutaceae bacterium]